MNKNGRKKIIALLLAAVCAAGQLDAPIMAYAQEALQAEGEVKAAPKIYTYGNWEYSLREDGTVYIENYDGSDSVVEIPAEIDGRAVTAFTRLWYPCNLKITTLIIPETVTYFRTDTISNPSSELEEIIVKEGNPVFQSVDGVVYDKQMKTLLWCPKKKSGSLTVPQGVETIGEYGLAYSRLSEILLPDSLQEIGQSAFLECRFTDVNIPKSVKKIGRDAFDRCGKIKEIRLPDGIKTINRGLFSYCGKLSDIYIPKSVNDIGDFAFSDCSRLETIYLPKGLKSIGQGAFSNCGKLNNVVIPEGTTSIGDWAFSGCGGLESIFIPDSVKKIGSYAFSKSKKVTIECSDKSYAQKYAQKNGIPYRIVGKAPQSKLGLTVNAQSVKDGQTLKVKLNKSYAVQAVRGGVKAEVKWKTSNAKVASVKNGKITVKKAGQATITATASDGKKTRIKLSASKAAVRVSKVQVSGSKTMKKGSKQILGLTVTPATANSTKVSWKSSDKKIATVDKNGKVVAKKKGSVVITATAKDGSKKKGSIKIKVK